MCEIKYNMIPERFVFMITSDLEIHNYFIKFVIKEHLCVHIGT